MAGMLWEYRDSAGTPHQGRVERTGDYGGTDVVYFFRGSCGTLSVLSGSRVREAHTLNRDADTGKCEHSR